MVGIALLVFPKLALGLSGFETGVAVMPQIKGDAATPTRDPARADPRRAELLTTAAVIMSVFLLVSSFVDHHADPAADVRAGGPANGRALAYLAHEYLGEAFGTVYDVSTIAILWFAGASAHGRTAQPRAALPAALRHGAGVGAGGAARWCWSSPAIAFVDHLVFDADVDAQGGAYATGVLVLITSAAVAVDAVAPGGGGSAAPRRPSASSRCLRLHDGRQRHRAARRRQDRAAASSSAILVVVVRVAGAARLRAARRPR